MRKRVVFCLLAAMLSLVSWAWSQTNPNPTASAAVKVGVINMQRAIAESTDGKKAAEELTKRFTPKRNELQKKQDDVARLQKQLEAGRRALNDEKRAELTRELERKTKEFNRDNEDANSDFQRAEAQIVDSIGQKMMQVIDEYARKHSYDVILDISSPQSEAIADVSSRPNDVLWATSRIDFTDPRTTNRTKPGAGGAPGHVSIDIMDLRAIRGTDITDEIIAQYNATHARQGEKPKHPAPDEKHKR